MVGGLVLTFELPANPFRTSLSSVRVRVGSSPVVVVSSALSPPSFVVSLAAAFVKWSIYSLPYPIGHANTGQRRLVNYGNFETDFLLSVARCIGWHFLIQQLH